MLDFWLIFTLGFLGSFGHCVGMCGPLAAAFSLSQTQNTRDWQKQLQFHILLNLGRTLSYMIVGAAIGAIGSVFLASGQVAGVGSDLRRVLAIITGLMLIWFGLRQIKPDLLPRVPLLHPLLQGKLHDRLNAAMLKLSLKPTWWTPALLGMTWGLIPCGFLYAAQIKAAETGDLIKGATTMLAFGLGTLPTMLGVGVSTSVLSKDKRSQLFRLGGWVTLIIGALTLLRTGDMMVDFTGHAALFCLMLALIARPISNLWAAPLRYRRALGVGAYILSLAHTTHMLQHSLDWNLEAFWFLPLQFQWGIAAGGVALILMTPAALTSFDSMQKKLGQHWRSIHLFSVPALIFAATHAAATGSRYLGALSIALENQLAVMVLTIVTLTILLVRLQSIK
ncbi:ferric reductase domain-containing protein [Calothrix sp. NIES-4071]|nr:ferric reductase domain-containing protein [Calothrix sp. NIES-4071]BAZ57481.1 ferric reductase domain-containing protein [Calothrix sp. NIES-4105]